MLLIYENAGQLTLLSTAAGVPVESVVDQIPEGAPWAIVAGDLPSAPRDTWIVDWDTGVITVDPGWAPPPPVEPTDWDGLNLAIMGDATFNAAYGAVMQSHPLIAAALPAALTQVATGQFSMFGVAFVQMCAAAEVSPQQREAWAQIAEAHHAPAEFVAIVRGA